MVRDAGFTLIEIVLSLVLVGIMAVVGGMAIVTGMKGYLLAKENVSVTQKAHIALSRLNREMMEIMNITTATSTSLVYQRPSGSHALALVGDNLKIVDGTTLPDTSSGNILLDHVSSIQIDYFKGSANWVPGTDDIALLSGIKITLAVTRSNASISNPTFSTLVTPRNNGNLGGSAPSTSPPPAATNYSCFVATAVYGQPDHPVVEMLRQFRDRFLTTWSGGRALIDFYYSFGPMLADLIRPHPVACLMGRIILSPIVILAFLLLYCPAGISAILLLCCILPKAVRAIRGKHPAPDRSSPSASSQRGSVLIGLIVTMVILGVLAASILSLTSTSTFETVAGTSAMRAYFLAESGYRFVGSQFLNAGDETAKDNKLQSLHNQTFSLSGSEGKFFLQNYPYYYRTTADPVGTATLSTRVPGGFPPGLNLTNGYLRVNGRTYQYQSATVNDPSVTFTLNGGNWPISIPVGDIVRPVAKPNGTQTINGTTHNYIDIETTTGAINAFPLQNSTFRTNIGGQLSQTVYTYKNRTNNRLSGIKLSGSSTSSFSFAVDNMTDIVGEKFVQVHSTGILNEGGVYETKRKVSYDTPIGYASSMPTQKSPVPPDPFDNMNNWFTGSGQGEVGGHSIASVSGSNALHVTSGQNAGFFGGAAGGYWSWLSFNWSQANANLQNAWWYAGRLLSYDLQVKVKATNQAYFMAGMSFRMQSAGTELYTYGVSYLKARQTKDQWWFFGWQPWSSYWDNGDIPSGIVPPDLYSGTLETGSNYSLGLLHRGQDRYSLPAIVLWQRTSAGFKWLAYKLLTSSDYVIANNASGWPRLVDWSNLQVRVIEAIPLTFSNGSLNGSPYPPLWGEKISGETSGASAYVNGTPILTSGDWSTSNATGTLALYSLTGTFASGENLTIDGVVRGRVSAAPGSKTNYLRAYYADTSSHTPNNIPTDNNRGADPRITTTGQTVYWPEDNISKWASSNDLMTLVCWDAVNTSVTRIGTGSELNAIIQDSALITPSTGETFTSSEIALHTAGGGSPNTPDIYFDDFAIQFLGSPTAGSSGFLSPIQQ